MKPSADDLASDPLLASAPVLEGFKVLDPAVLYARIGGGGMGAVYRGRHFSLECDVAVKVLKADLAHDEQFVSRFEREARLAARIKNDNVVQVLDVRHQNGIHYLVMEFVKGETARERVQRKGKLAEREALAILLGAARGLRAAHQEGIVHRDIKPDNVLISAEGAVKLADLGLAKQKQGGGESMTILSSGVMGTPQYMPPEQWKSSDVKPAADVWALGATLWYLLVGKSAIKSGELLAMADEIRNHDFPDLAAARPDVRPEVVALVARCTRRDPAERFADARELLAALKPLCSDDDELLRDAESGNVNSKVGTVTPPPRSTLAKIKLQITQSPEDAMEVAALAKSEQPTILQGARRPDAATEVRPAPSATMPVAPPATVPAKRRGPLVVGALLFVALGVAGYGASAGWFGGARPDESGGTVEKPAPKPAPKPEPLPGEDPQRGTGLVSADAAEQARAALARAQALLPVKGEIDNAIAALEEALRLDGLLVEAQRALALALVHKSKDLEAADPDAALLRVRRALVLAKGDAAATEVQTRLEAVLRARLLAGVTVTEPAADAVSGDRDVRLRGSVAAPKFAALRGALVPAGGVAGAPFPRAGSTAVPVVAGDFDVRLAAAADGKWLVRLEAEDVHGLVAELPARAVTVNATLPTLQIESPVAEALVGPRVPFVVRAGEGAVAVRIGGTAAQLTDGRWRAEITLADGAQRVAVVVQDGLAREARTELPLRVDAKAPVLQVPEVPPVVNWRSMDMKVRADDANLATVRIGGEVVPAQADGSFVAAVPLAEDRAYEIDIEASDRVGTTTRQVVRVRRDTTAPVLAWRSPTTDTVPAGRTMILGRVADDTACVVEVNGAAAPVTDGAWVANLEVPVGQQVAITVTARDAAGNAAAPIEKALRGEVMVAPLPWADAVEGAPIVIVGGMQFPAVVVERATGMRMRLIAPGTFTMGSPASEAERGNDEVAHAREIQQPFWLGETEVTQAQWLRVMAQNPSQFAGDEFPVDGVSWYDCQDFVKKLNERVGGAAFRLPSEAEWEYACRAGTTTPFAFGADLTTDQANYDGSHPYVGGSVGANRQRTVAAGSLPANPWGLHEMHGNLWEWCEDTRSPYPGTGTQAPARGEGSRVLRGGTWFFGAKLCRSADRHGDEARFRAPSVGFRLARTLD